MIYHVTILAKKKRDDTSSRRKERFGEGRP